MNKLDTLYAKNRKAWRNWLEKNHKEKKEIWLVFPHKSSGKPRISYNDAVEEAICFGWIDSTVRSYDEEHSIQRFTPRNPKSSWSQSNIERLKWLSKHKMVHSEIEPNVQHIIDQEFIFPEDIIAEIKKDITTWENFQNFSESYKRIRIAYIDNSRERPEEFQKRLLNFLGKTRQNKLITGHGGIDKYY